MNVFESPMYKLSGFRVPLLPKVIMTTTAMIVGAAVIDRHVTPLTTRVDRRHWNNTLVDLEVSDLINRFMEEEADNRRSLQHATMGSVPPISTAAIESVERTVCTAFILGRFPSPDSPF